MSVLGGDGDDELGVAYLPDFNQSLSLDGEGDNDTVVLAGSISLTFMVYVFVNTAMVTGLVPVVGVPLPLISYGGTSMVTLMVGFGILMSIHTHRKLVTQ